MGPSTSSDDHSRNRDDPLATQPTAPGEAAAPRMRDRPHPGTRYEPIRFHAEGGLGEVHVARDREVKREVALKRLQARHAHNEDCRVRFLREAQITARLEHPGIVPVYGVVEDAEGQPSYAMRFVEGETLHDALRAFHRPQLRCQQATMAVEAETLEFGGTRIPEDERDQQQAGGGRSFHSVEFRQLLQRFVTVCNTMAYAHSKGVVHRDLKPANILLGKYGETLVVDWGLAKCLDADAQAGELETTDYSPELLFASQADRAASEADASDGSLTLAGQALGTPVFMSPEQAAGDWDRVGRASDIYSLGATLYALLTGSPPIRERVWESIRQKILSGEFPAPRQVRKDVPRALEAVCLKAMSRQPEDRYPSALTLAREVEHWLADEPVTSWREPWRDQALRWARRHRPAVAAALMAAVLLVIGAVTGLWFWRTAEQRRAQSAEHYSSNLRSDAEAAERLALAAVAVGDYPAAAAILGEKLRSLDNEPGHQDLRDRLTARHQRVKRLVRFYTLSDSAERLVLHLSDQDAARACEAGLQELCIFDHPIWWEHLPIDDLPARSQLISKLHEDVYRQLLLLASFRAKDAFVRILTPSAAQPYYRSALEALAAAQRFRPSHMATLGEAICRVGLGEAKNVQPLPPPTPTCATDYYFLGFIQFWVAPLVEQDWISGMLVRTFKGLSGLDFQTPLATAERYLRMAAALDPEHYWTHAWLSTVLMAARKPADAYLAANACVALRPNEATGIRLRGRALLALAMEAKNPERKAEHLWRGLVDFDQAVSLAPYDADTHYYGLLLYDSLDLWPELVESGGRTFELLPPSERDGNWDQEFRKSAVRSMLEKFSEARHPRPGDPHYFAVMAGGYLQLDDFDKALQMANRALSLQSMDPRALAVRGHVHLQRKDVEAAVKDLDAALAQEPDSFLALSGRARAGERLERWEDARALYDRLERASALPWQRREALRGLSRALQRLGRDAESRAAAEQAKNLDPTTNPPPRSDRAGPLPANAASPDFVEPGTKLDRKYALVHVYRSLAYEQQQRTKEAEEEWRKALRLAPNTPELFLHRGAALRDAGQLDRAIADSTAAIDMEKDNASYYCARANCYALQKRHSEALADFQAALQIHPSYVPALVDRGQLYVNTRDYDRAIADFTEALRLFPQAKGEILGKRGAAYRLRGELAKALEDLNTAIKLHPKDAGLYTERGLLHRARRDHERAVADFDTAAKLDPKRASHPQ